VEVEQGKSKMDSTKSVFINCPFDQDYASLFEAIVFSVVSCGFKPRSALESGTVAETRVERVTRAIFSSKYSIHDLSRCKGEGSEQFARFNMPLELGIAMARRHLTKGQQDEHDWLLLVPEGHVYLKFVSDLAGFDPMRYDGDVKTIIQRVMSWLATRPDATHPPSPNDVHGALSTFRAEVSQLRQQWGVDAPWSYVVEAAEKTAPKPLYGLVAGYIVEQKAIASHPTRIQAGYIRIDTAGEVWLYGRKVVPSLTKKEQLLLEYLCLAPGHLRTKDEVVAVVYPEEYQAGNSPTDDALNQLVKRLRDRLDQTAKCGHCIETVRGKGYRLKID
jgi:hypothetical protein